MHSRRKDNGDETERTAKDVVTDSPELLVFEVFVLWIKSVLSLPLLLSVTFQLMIACSLLLLVEHLNTDSLLMPMPNGPLIWILFGPADKERNVTFAYKPIHLL